MIELRPTRVTGEHNMAIEPSQEDQSQTFIPDDMLIEYEASAKSRVMFAAMDDELRSSERHALRSRWSRELIRPATAQNTISAILVAFAAPTIWLTLGSASAAWAVLAGLVCAAACLDLIVAIATVVGRNRQPIKDNLRMLFSDQERPDRQGNP